MVVPRRFHGPYAIAGMLPQSPAAEAYREIRTRLQFMAPEQGIGMVVFTSALSEEGKTTTALNVGVVFAQAGQRTLLVDGDLRRPALARAFGMDPEAPGLSQVTDGIHPLNRCVTPTSVPNLWILPSGPVPTNPAEHLVSPGFTHAMDRARAEFDLVLLDSPPVLAVSDALILARQADGAVLVVDARRGNRILAQKATRALEQVHARVLGAVLNHQARLGRHAYQQGYYGYVERGRP